MKKRLDQILVERGLLETRTKAQAVIMSGKVFVDGKKVDKAGMALDEDSQIEVEEAFPYVSRGALKLEKAFQEFDLNFKGKVICDIGSSTGGFTDFALQHGAEKVFAVDVGTGQLAQKIREDQSVVVMERTDFRDISFCLPSNSRHPEGTKDPVLRNSNTDNCLSDPIDMFVCDVSFISLKQIIPKISELIDSFRHSELVSESKEIPKQVRDDSRGVDCILLVKPQFEVGRIEASRGKGVITNPELHNKVIQEIQDCALESGFTIKGIVPSPITGAKGNKEFLLYITK